MVSVPDPALAVSSFYPAPFACSIGIKFRLIQGEDNPQLGGLGSS